MATSKAFLDFILDQLSDLKPLTYRAMMGEYILYYDQKIAAYLCDGRLLVKPVPSALRMLPDATREPPYAGAKEMLVAEAVDDRDFLTALFRAMETELPAPKSRAKKKMSARGAKTRKRIKADMVAVKAPIVSLLLQDLSRSSYAFGAFPLYRRFISPHSTNGMCTLQAACVILPAKGGKLWIRLKSENSLPRAESKKI